MTFTGIVTAEEVGSCKPSLGNFEALLAEAIRFAGRLGRGWTFASMATFADAVEAADAS